MPVAGQVGEVGWAAGETSPPTVELPSSYLERRSTRVHELVSVPCIVSGNRCSAYRSIDPSVPFSWIRVSYPDALPVIARKFRFYSKRSPGLDYSSRSKSSKHSLRMRDLTGWIGLSSERDHRS